MAFPLNPNSTETIRPAQYGFAITAGASALPHPTRGIYVGASGNVTVTLVGSGQSVQFVGLAAGVIHPIAASHVTAATATGILGVY
jgi:hypothetical protein